MRIWASVTLLSVLGCASSQMTRHIEEVDELLVVGQSTKADVMRIFGKPNGVRGEAFFPPLFRRQEVWYWREQPQTSNVEIDYDKKVAYADVQMRVLIILFRDGVYDGFLYWGSEHKKGSFR